MDDPNITMEEYIRLKEEKAHRRAIVFNDALTFEVTLSFEPTVCPLNDHKIDLRTSFDESDDEDYTVIYDENLFSYKIIYVNNLKTESKNDNDKVNMPSFSSPEPEVSYSNDLDYFKDLESEFPAIVYNDALKSKLDFFTKPTINPQHIDEFNLKDETLLSESDEEEQNVLYFNDLFPFNVIYLDDLKSDTDNDNDGIDIEQPSGDMSVIPLPKVQYGVSLGLGYGILIPDLAKTKSTNWWSIFTNGCCYKTSSAQSSEFELWKIRIEQYFLMTDYALWEVIVNGYLPPPKRTVDGVEQTYPPTTAEEKLARKNELKARGTLLMALPNEHQLKFNTYKCAKTLMEAIEKRFGGSKKSNKTQNTNLKQQYENFNGSSSEGLDQTYDRLQKLISQLEILGETISQEDMNLKFLRSLPSEWKTHTLIWRNKPDLDTLSMDDLYNNLKIYETEVKGSSSSNQNSQNVAFVSSNNSGSSNQAHGSNSANTDSMSDVIDVDDLEEIDLKWQMAMLTMRARRFLNKTGRKISANGSETIGFNKSKVECYNCHKRGHFARECRAPRENRNREPVRRNVTVETTETKALVAQDGLGSSSSDSKVSTCSKACLKSYETLKEHYDNLTKDFNKSQLNVGAYKAGLESVEARLDVYKKNEVVFEEDIKILKLDIMLRDNALTELRKKFEKVEKERDDLKLTLEKFKNSSKNLSKLLEIQVSDKFKTGVGYDSQVVDSQVFDSQVNDKYKSCEGYHAVPPPYTGNFMPPKSDLVLADEDLKEDGIFISQEKYVTEILKKFGFTDVKTVSILMETQKLFLKDEDGEEVDLHLYRSMIGSLMYLTSLRPDIMFVVCACARYQVNPKVSHLLAVKMIFRYLKGQPKLGLWYPKDSPFDLVAYTDSDYAGASLDRKSIT
ncbi:putative ribonuclease H-like domain-containing protein [Tanacetum coccineum]|uniref:Ribonuclease H-like domain-containing protein n=1 Tax=Tanacetum coccineum TaxID=301880 RepID=A0ABQ4YNG4_9ASTR